VAAAIPLAALVAGLTALSSGAGPMSDLIGQVSDPAAVAAAQQPAAANANCTLIVPAHPLSAAGLATPYQLVATDPAAGPCHEANQDQSAFVQGAIFSPSGRLTLYNPLVIDAGTQPAAPPAPAVVGPGSVVALWFGFNGDALTLRSADGTNALQQGACINGSATSIFGQFAACNTRQFFRAAAFAISRGALRVPRLGTARDGLPCPTVRDFSVVDQDQSDNVNTHYLATADGRTAQPNAAGNRALGVTTDLANGSDNRLLTEFILPTLGCRSFTRPDQSNNAQPTASLPLQEIQAAFGQRAPVALVPLNDPMTLEGDQRSVAKTNLFRAAVAQPPVSAQNPGDPAAYCRGIYTDPRGIQRVFRSPQIYAQGRSPNADAGNSLFTFLAVRASDAFGILGCGDLLGQRNPITLTMDANGVATNAKFTPGGAPAAMPAASPAATPASTPAATGGTTPAAGPTASPAPGAPAGATPSSGATAAPGAPDPGTATPSSGATAAPGAPDPGTATPAPGAGAMTPVNPSTTPSAGPANGQAPLAAGPPPAGPAPHQPNPWWWASPAR
jgi:hypothetical protein